MIQEGHNQDFEPIEQSRLTPDTFGQQILYEIQCVVCLTIVQEPLSCDNCCMVICQKCYQTLKNNQKQCMLCKKNFANKMPYKNMILKSIIEKITVMCIYQKNGCKQILSCSPYILCKHEQDCGYQLIQCINAGCALDILKKDQEAHNQICEYLLVQCKYCYRFKKALFMRSAISQHEKYCSYASTPCKYCFKEINNNKLLEHQENCQEKYKRCQFCQEQFEKEDFSKHNQFECIQNLFRKQKKEISSLNQTLKKQENKIGSMEGELKNKDLRINSMIKEVQGMYNSQFLEENQQKKQVNQQNRLAYSQNYVQEDDEDDEDKKQEPQKVLQESLRQKLQKNKENKEVLKQQKEQQMEKSISVIKKEENKQDFKENDNNVKENKIDNKTKSKFLEILTQDSAQDKIQDAKMQLANHIHKKIKIEVNFDLQTTDITTFLKEKLELHQKKDFKIKLNNKWNQKSYAVICVKSKDIALKIIGQTIDPLLDFKLLQN